MSSFRRVPPGEEFPVSATLFVTYQKCPQQALARLQGVYPEPSVALFRGSLAHRVFAKHLTDGPIASEDFESVCRREVGAHLGGTMAALAMKPSEFRGLTADVQTLYERFKEVSTDGFVGAELEVDGNPVEGIQLRGRVDAVFEDDDGLRIVDWKTGTYLDDAEAQLGFYAMSWNVAHGTVPDRLEALSLKTGERREVIPTEASLAETEAGVADMISLLREAMRDGTDMPRTAGPHCRWCPLLDNCTEGAVALKILE